MREDCMAFEVYRKIKERILSLAYFPGAALQERQLAEQFGVSRTPVREAVQQLAQEGWVSINARKYIQVRNLDTLDLNELFQTRRVLEGGTVDLIFSHGLSENVVKAMTEAMMIMRRAEDDIFEFITADQLFHSVPFSLSGNQYLQEFWSCINDEMIWVGMLVMDEVRFDAVLNEHREIMEAFKAGHPDDVRTALRGHLMMTEKILTNKINSSKFRFKGVMNAYANDNNGAA